MNMYSKFKEVSPLTYPKHHGATVVFQNIAKRYGSIEAVSPTSLKIEAGEFFAIIGPSGSGKSTLLGIVAGFVAPTGGSISVDGHDIVSRPPYHRNFGMVFQNYALFPHMSVAQNIAFPLRMRGMTKAQISQKVSDALSMVRLEGLGERRPAELSGGQQQRVALARAAVYDPLLLLMDEPLGALDKNLREEMQDEIKRFQKSLGATVIYVTHDQHEAANMADRLAIMRDGRIEQVGTPRTLYEAPSNIFVASFLGEASIIPVKTDPQAEGDIVLADIGGGLAARVVRTKRGDAANYLCIRPESAMIGESAVACHNVFDGIVDEVVFTTGTVRYRIQLKGTEHVLTIRVPSRPGLMLHPPGEAIKIGWNSCDASLISG